MELINLLGFEIVKKTEIEIPEEHKELVRKRIQKSNQNPEQLLDWDEVKDNFKLS